jgi:hypothetical protein
VLKSLNLIQTKNKNFIKMSDPKINEMLSELRIEDTPSPPRHRRRRVVYVEDTDSDEDFDQKATQTGSNLIIEDTC